MGQDRIMGQEEEFVKRWIAQIDEHQFIMFDDEEDVDDWDCVLEVTIPATMAVSMDFTQHAYYTFQRYCSLQWEIMQRKLEAAGSEEVVYDGDNTAFQSAFDSIIRNNNLEGLGNEED